MRRRTRWAWAMAVVLLAACGQSAGQGVTTDAAPPLAASSAVPPTGPLTTVVEAGATWAVLPAGAAVARADPPAGFVPRREFLMVDPSASDEASVRFVEKFVRAADGRAGDVLDVHSFRATDALRRAVAEPPAGYRATTVRGRPAIIDNGRPGTVIGVSWLEDDVLGVGVFGVGDDVTAADVLAVAESVRVVPLPADHRLEVAG